MPWWNTTSWIAKVTPLTFMQGLPDFMWPSPSTFYKTDLPLGERTIFLHNLLLHNAQRYHNNQAKYSSTACWKLLSTTSGSEMSRGALIITSSAWFFRFFLPADEVHFYSHERRVSNFFTTFHLVRFVLLYLSITYCLAVQHETQFFLSVVSKSTQVLIDNSCCTALPGASERKKSLTLKQYTVSVF